MQHQPNFLLSELTELALAQELLRPHTNTAMTPPEDDVSPGAMIESFRRNRGLTLDHPEAGPARYVASPAMLRTIQLLSAQEIRRQQTNRFALFELFYARDGRYDGGRHTRTLVPIGRWTRLHIPLEHASEGAPLRLDPCTQPALIQIAWIALRRAGKVEWSLSGAGLAALVMGGDAVRLAAERTLQVRSTGDDPILYLPAEVVAGPPQVFDCWIKISRDE
jgi:hypothetical protein